MKRSPSFAQPTKPVRSPRIDTVDGPCVSAAFGNLKMARLLRPELVRSRVESRAGAHLAAIARFPKRMAAEAAAEQRTGAAEEWSGAELNCRHVDFQSTALPTELPDRVARGAS